MKEHTRLVLPDVVLQVLQLLHAQVLWPPHMVVCIGADMSGSVITAEGVRVKRETCRRRFGTNAVHVCERANTQVETGETEG